LIEAVHSKLQITMEIEMKRVLPLLFILLAGCSSSLKYNYQSQSKSDPQIIFGDRFGGSVLNGPSRHFSVNIINAPLHKCADIAYVGAASSDWLAPVSKTIEIKVPAKKAVSVFGSYLLTSPNSKVSCAPPCSCFRRKKELSTPLILRPPTTDAC
jgi:hypothetical protein